MSVCSICRGRGWVYTPAMHGDDSGSTELCDCQFPEDPTGACATVMLVVVVLLLMWGIFS